MASTKLLKVPGANAGAMNRLTAQKRGPMPLNAEQRKRAKHLRVDLNWDWPDIAADIGRSVTDVQHSLGNMRTPNPNPKRKSGNMSLAAHDHIVAQQLPGEAFWETINRLFGI